MKTDRSRLIGWLYLAVTVLIFSTFEITSKFLSPVMQPMQITSTRFLIGGLFLLPFTLFKMNKNHIRFSLSDWLVIGMLGLVNIVVSMGLLQLGLVYANASISAVLFSANPLFVVIFSRFVLGEKITLNKIAGLALGLLGIFILFTDSLQNKTATGFGLLLIAASALFFALYSVLGKKLMNQRKIGSLEITTFSFIIGSALMVPLQLFLNVPLIPAIKGSSVLPVLYMSIVVTGIAYVLYFEGLSRLEAGAGSMLYFAKPALASVLAVLILKESISVNLVLGIVVIAAGIFISQMISRKRLPQNPK